MTAIGTRSDILISTMPAVRVCGSSPIDIKEPQTFKRGPRYACCCVRNETPFSRRIPAAARRQGHVKVPQL